MTLEQLVSSLTRVFSPVALRGLVVGGLLATLLSPVRSRANTTINVDMDHGPTYSGTAAAPDSGTKWNSISGQGTLTNVLDSQGSALPGIDITFSSANGVYKLYNDGSSGNPTPSALMGDYTYGATYTLEVTGLTPGQAYELYAYSHGNKDNQTGTITLAAANGGASASTTSTGDAADFRDIYLYGLGYNYVVLDGIADASGNFTFTVVNYLNGFQLQRCSAPVISALTNQTVVVGTTTRLNPTVTGIPVPSYQWLSNNVAMVNETNASLVLNPVQYAQNGTLYSLVASNFVGAATNSMTLTVIVPPTISGLPGTAAAGVGSTVVFNATVSGAPAPVLQWQLNGTNLTDGPTGNGSVISGSTTDTLAITNAQRADSGLYSLIAMNSAGRGTNSVNLTVSSGNVAPNITGLTDQTAVQGSNATFSAYVSGLPVPMLQWQQNGVNISGATGNSLALTNVSYAQNGFTYSLVASNVAGMTTNSATLFVLVPPSISASPTNLVVTNTQSATFTVTADGVPVPDYQWYFNNSPIGGANGASYTLAHAAPANMGDYSVVVSNSVGSVTSLVATLTVNSTMAAVALSPTNGAAGVCYDTPLYITFSQTPVLGSTGKIRIYSITNSTTPVDTLDMSLNQTLQAPYAVNVQPRTIAGDTFNTFPVIITGNTAAIYPHLGVLTSNQTYYVTVDEGVFADTSGAYFAGINDTNAWRFTTKVSGPANPTNIVVAADGSGDFDTVQGAVDFIPANNTTPTTINIRNGTYTEIVDVKSKNDLDFRGQSRGGVMIGYPNNNNVNAGAPERAAFVLNGNDCSFENLTITNMTPKGGSQAEAIDVEGTRAIFYHMNLDSYQDTFLVHSAGKLVYFQDCLIQGDTDFNWGYGTVFWTNCELRVMSSGGHVTQPRSPAGQNGFSFVNCRVTAANSSVTSADLGRSIRTPDTPAEVIFSHCLMGDFITGYSSDAGTNFWDYADSNLTATLPKTLAYSTHLTASDPIVPVALSATNWLYGWQPELAPNITSQPGNQTVGAGQTITFTVSATGIPAPTYQWMKDGTNLVGRTGATLTIPNASALDIGTYSVMVSNGSGSVTSSNAVLTVSAPTTPPSLNSAMVDKNGNVQFTVSGPPGSAGFGYRVWATTNLALTPVMNTWTLVTNGVFGLNPMVLTNSKGVLPQRFYLITVP